MEKEKDNKGKKFAGPLLSSGPIPSAVRLQAPAGLVDLCCHHVAVLHYSSLCLGVITFAEFSKGPTKPKVPSYRSILLPPRSLASSHVAQAFPKGHRVTGVTSAPAAPPCKADVGEEDGASLPGAESSDFRGRAVDVHAL